jgi:hypothetical protein
MVQCKPSFEVHNREDGTRTVRAECLVRSGRVYYEVASRSSGPTQVRTNHEDAPPSRIQI